MPAAMPDVDVHLDAFGGNGRSGPGDARFGGSRGGAGSGGRFVPPEAYRLGMWFAIGGILMLFIAFSSAYIYRSGLSFDWQPMPLVPILWFNTVVILASSATLEWSRRMLKRDEIRLLDRGLTLTALLGVVFLSGQVLAWRQLSARGIFLASNPHSSFFYLLTGAHAVHLLGGLVAIFFLLAGAFRRKYSARQNTAVEVTTTYWHFMGGLWVYLFMLLFLWR